MLLKSGVGRRVSLVRRNLVAAAVLVLLGQIDALAQARRVIVLKVDGLAYDSVERFASERDRRTGKSRLPWFEYLFYQRGTRLTNFYVRGLSLSGPSWSLINTGQHLQIKGNVEFDRLTLHSYDYLNFFPFYLNNALSRREDMPAVEVLDELGVPLLIDLYPMDQRYQSFQLFQRGVRWSTLGRGLKNHFIGRAPGEFLSEWASGFGLRGLLTDQQERELIQRLSDPCQLYLDYFTSEFDHTTHHNRDAASQLAALQSLDGLIGRIWTAVERSPLADETVLIVISDHGTNSDEKVYSQGFSLIELLTSAAGGGHHVVTKRRPMTDYTVMGLNPLIPLVVTPSQSSFYLKGQQADYPTAVLDFDGNERASIHLRDSDLNLLQLLLRELKRRDLAPSVRRAATAAFFETVEKRRAEWAGELREIRQGISALRGAADREGSIAQAGKKKWTAAEKEAGLDKGARRLAARVDQMEADLREYGEFARILENLASLTAEGFNPDRLDTDKLIPKRSMGFANTIHRLQNYVVGLGPAGLVLRPDGSLDLDNSFKRIDYFALLRGATVRNNVQPGVGNRPVDWTAVRIPLASLADVLAQEDLPDDDAVWLYAGPDCQALILSRDRRGQIELRYLPIANLTQQEGGAVRFDRADWKPGFPLKLWEDQGMSIPTRDRESWLNRWHHELDWFRAVHQSQYSNAIIGLHEQMARHSIDDGARPGDDAMLRRFRIRQRQFAEADILVLASNHWNFDVRGFNPGGNHGSFFRQSTHSTLMFAGGSRTGVPRGLAVDEPYDSLSFAPSLLALTQGTGAGPITRVRMPALGIGPFPGRVIKELFESERQLPAVSSGGLR
jgi:hypothetical protein